jgi:phosphoglucomutase/phosphomannomutase
LAKSKPVFTKKDYIESWTKEPFSKEVQKEAQGVLELFQKGENSSEVEAYTIPLEFGTGGIRGVIGNGIGRMNEYTVGRAALGFSRYLVSKFKKPTIVIAYDSRKKSKVFARVTAGIAAQNGIKVKLFPIETPTPILSYSIPHYKAQGGVVITASHNPSEYNGFKAYLADGGQLVPPDDGKIIALINSITDWNEISLITDKDPIYKKFVSEVTPDVFESYMKKVFSSGIYNTSIDNKLRAKTKIVYSPLHGTGGAYMKKLLNAAGYKNVFLVPEQSKPNGEFPTVKYPNPEEKEALVLCEKYAKDRSADIFVATDPDADRMGVGIRNSNGEYILLNGNQIGSILCAYLAEKVTSNGKPKFDYHIFKTIVTTDLQLNIAKKNKLKLKDVLTGFKYIANEMNKIAKDKKKKFLFGGEESYGYLPVDFVRDKDSLSSTLLLLEVLSEKKDLLAYLDEIYLKYGFYLESLKSIGLKGEAGKQKIQESLELLRNSDLLGKSIGKRNVIAVLDFKSKKGKGEFPKSVFAGLPPSDVVQVYLSGNAKLTIRPSGTEPKVKIYSSFQSLESPQKREDLPRLKESLHAEILESEEQFLKMAGLDG